MVSDGALSRCSFNIKKIGLEGLPSLPLIALLLKQVETFKQSSKVSISLIDRGKSRNLL